MKITTLQGTLHTELFQEIMLHENLNLDFGLGVWGGQKTYITYACPSCGRITGKGSRWFILPNEIRVALQYIF